MNRPVAAEGEVAPLDDLSVCSPDSNLPSTPVFSPVDDLVDYKDYMPPIDIAVAMAPIAAVEAPAAAMAPVTAPWAPATPAPTAPTALIGWFGAPVAMPPWVYLPVVAPIGAFQASRAVWFDCLFRFTF